MKLEISTGLSGWLLFIAMMLSFQNCTLRDGLHEINQTLKRGVDKRK